MVSLLAHSVQSLLITEGCRADMRNGAALAEEVLQEITDKDDANPVFGVRPQNDFICGIVHIGRHHCVLLISISV